MLPKEAFWTSLKAQRCEIFSIYSKYYWRFFISTMHLGTNIHAESFVRKIWGWYQKDIIWKICDQIIASCWNVHHVSLIISDACSPQGFQKMIQLAIVLDFRIILYFRWLSIVYQYFGMTINDYQAQYSKKEESANVMTHGIGIVLSLIGMVLLSLKASRLGDQWYFVSYIVFGISLLTMFTSSTLYHIVRDQMAKKKLRKLDHSAIYVLIAGTYTPFLLTNLRGTTGWIMFAVVWIFAIVGIAVKLATQIKSKWVSAVIYLVMGWLAVFIAQSMINNLPAISIVYLALGGLFYTFGVIFYIWKNLPYHHAIWHLFVLGGSISHFLSVYYLM